MTPEARGPGGKLGPPVCAVGRAPDDDPAVPRPTPDASPAEEETVYFCDLCGARMIDRHCKLACPACGYQRDCSDP